MENTYIFYQHFSIIIYVRNENMHNHIKDLSVKKSTQEICFGDDWSYQQPPKVKGDPDSQVLVNVEIFVVKQSKIASSSWLGVDICWKKVLPDDQSDYVSYT